MAHHITENRWFVNLETKNKRPNDALTLLENNFQATQFFSMASSLAMACMH